MFMIELLAPLLIFTPRIPRFVAFWSILILMVLIEITGNFGPFNLLTMVLCVALLDDQLLPSIRRFVHREQVSVETKAGITSTVRLVASGLRVTILIALLLLSVMAFMQTFFRYSGKPSPVRMFTSMTSLVSPFRITNHYGLFAVMTKERKEIIIEGSNDGIEWKPYEFKYKPVDPAKRPPFIGPHMPRLDWQMWFAALGNYREYPWFLSLMERLAEGSPEVLSLLEENPFPQKPPEYLRARLFEYTFSSPKEKREENLWWHRKDAGYYVPGVLEVRND